LILNKLHGVVSQKTELLNSENVMYIGKPEGRRSFRPRWQNDIKMKLEEIGARMLMRRMWIEWRPFVSTARISGFH
jgi:hypothetical protein